MKTRLQTTGSCIKTAGGQRHQHTTDLKRRQIINRWATGPRNHDVDLVFIFNFKVLSNKAAFPA